MDDIVTKKCHKCGEVKPLSLFTKNKSCRDGVEGTCKACTWLRSKNPRARAIHTINSRNWELRHPEQRREIVKAQYWKNPEKFRERRRRYIKENPEKEHEARMALWRKNLEENRARARRKVNKAYHESAELREQYRLNGRLRRVRKAGAPGNGWTLQEEKQLIAEYGGRCIYCREKILAGEMTIDHVVPITRGGEHSIENVVPCCKSCNSSKNNTPLLIWMARNV